MSNSFIKKKAEAVIILEQNNIQQTIFINDLNLEAEKLLVYSKEELYRKPVSLILSPATNQIISENLIFAEHNEQENLFNVVNRIKHFQILNKNQVIKLVKVKIFPLLCKDTRIMEFKMILRDLNLLEKIANERLALPNYTINLNEKLQILTKESFLTELNLLTKLTLVEEVEAIMGEITFEREEFLPQVVNVLKTNIRESDLIGYISERKILFILLECTLKEARGILQRIWEILQNIIGNEVELQWVNLKDKFSKDDIVERFNLQ